MPPPIRTAYDDTKYPGIIIQHESAMTSTFHYTIRELLDMIASKPVGHQLLSSLATNSGVGCPGYAPWGGARLLIKRSSVSATTIGKPGEEGGNVCKRINELDAVDKTKGTPSYIEFNPNIYVVPGKGPRPPYIGLAHEMCHALHNAMGEAFPDLESEESRTVGIGKWAGEAICENAIREEHKIAKRDSY